MLEEEGPKQLGFISKGHATQNYGVGNPSLEAGGGLADGWKSCHQCLPLHYSLCSSDPQWPCAVGMETDVLLDLSSREVLLSQLWKVSL